MAKRKNRNKYAVQRKAKGSWTRLLLALTLVPLIFGVGLIAAWAFDFHIFGVPETQTLLAGFFILMSFAASNALQKHRDLAIGWFLLMVVDLVFLVWVQLWAQVVAAVVGLAGLGFLLAGFHQRYQVERAKRESA